jgi:hypothetical protein
MTRGRLILAASAAFCAAASAPAAGQGLPAGLDPLGFLVGHCWRGEFQARKQVDTHCFEPVYGGKHIRDRHEVTGGKDIYRGETIYSWNAALGRVEYTYWNSLGGVSRGTMVPKGGALDFGSETHIRGDGTTMTISTLWQRKGPDAYDAVSSTNGITGDRVTTYKRVD